MPVSPMRFIGGMAMMGQSLPWTRRDRTSGSSNSWYIAYQRHAIPGGDGTHRETAIDRLAFGEDGVLRPVIPTLEGVVPLPRMRA